MGKKKGTITSALTPLIPAQITNLKTGEIDPVSFETDLEKLVTFVTKESETYWENNKDNLEERLEEATATSPSEIGREAGIDTEALSLDRSVRAKSRIERLIRHKIVSQALSYYRNTDEKKQEPTFHESVNLGAVDTQMAKLAWDGHSSLIMTIKCWENEYELEFTIPDYVLGRNISKFSLPRIQKLNDDWVFSFSIEEFPSPASVDDRFVAGIDLGRVEPYTLAIVQVKTGSRVAVYQASAQIKHLCAKRDRLNEELGHIWRKLEAYKALGLPLAILKKEQALTRSKRSRLLNTITWLIATEVENHVSKYNPQFVALEDLSWVSPAKGMSRWTHSKDQSAITHKLSRSGRKTRKINPKNTSKDCSKCGGVVVQKSGKRLVVCSDCSFSIDRDINAAVNITCRPLPKRSKGNNCSPNQEQVMANRPVKRLITRKTS